MVADVDADDGVGGDVPPERVEDRRRGQSPAPVVGDAARLFSAPQCPARRHVRPLVHPGRGTSRTAVEGRRQGEQAQFGVAEHPDVHLLEAADGGVVIVDLDGGFVRRDAGVVRERRADDDQQVCLVHQPAGDRGAAAAQHARPERVGVRQ